MKDFDRKVRRGTDWLALLGFVGLFILALMMTIDALMRSFFSAPLHGVNDVSAVVMAVVIASCIPSNLAGRRNIAVNVLGAIMGPRANRVLSLFSSLAVLAFIAVMAWKFIPFTESMFESDRRTWVLNWPVWPWWGVATLFLIFAAYIQLSNVVQDAVALVRGQDTAEAKSAAEAVAKEVTEHSSEVL